VNINKLSEQMRNKYLVNQFAKLYYNPDKKEGKQIWANTYWRGVITHKCPLDLWIYQEIIQQVLPDVIIETGTAFGGSALFLANICDCIGRGRIITVDITDSCDVRHERVTYLLGSSIAPEIIRQIYKLIKPGERVMVILDSDHSKAHVQQEILLYNQMVSIGSYLIVEDTNINGHPVLPAFGPGPMEALDEFLRTNDIFVIDKDREKFYLTFNPNGYLRRVK
jgi:cephalosporin hydroxylase